MTKVALITGVSSGFGKSTAEFLSQAGYKVYGTIRKPSDNKVEYTLIQMDVTEDFSVEKAVKQVIDEAGHIDILINNAGMGITGAMEETTLEEAHLQLNTNFYGAFRTCKAVLPYMRKRGNGLIINTSSIGGLMGLPFQGFYSASKFAIEGFSEALRMEVKQFNIKVVVVEPGDFNTHFTANRKLIASMNDQSPYLNTFNKTIKIIECDEGHGLPPQKLAKRILSICQSKCPCHRYIVATFSQKLAVFLKKILPPSVFQQILASHYKV